MRRARDKVGPSHVMGAIDKTEAMITCFVLVGIASSEQAELALRAARCDGREIGDVGPNMFRRNGDSRCDGPG